MDGSLTEGKRPSGPSREEVQRGGLVPVKCPEVNGPAVSVAVRWEPCAASSGVNNTGKVKLIQSE